MSINQRKDIVTNIVNALRLSATDPVPDQVADNLQPVFIANKQAPKIKFFIDAVVNDSDKSFTVPTGKIWKVRGVHVLLSTTVTVGNRQMAVHFLPDGTNPISILMAGLTQAASLNVFYIYADMGIQETATISGRVKCPMQTISLPAGAVITVSDVNAVAAAADDMTVTILYEEFDEIDVANPD